MQLHNTSDNKKRRGCELLVGGAFCKFVYVIGVNGLQWSGSLLYNGKQSFFRNARSCKTGRYMLHRIGRHVEN